MLQRAPDPAELGWGHPGLRGEPGTDAKHADIPRPAWPLRVWGLLAHSGQKPMVKWSFTGHRLGLKLTHGRAARLGIIKSAWIQKPVFQNLGQRG